MAKGVHSKRRKRNQSIKRKVLYDKLFKERIEETSKRLFKRTFGMGDDSVVTNKKNAFRFPKDLNALYPQVKDPVYIDRRTSAVPREYLIKEKGTKMKNLKKQNKLKELNEEMKRVEGSKEDEVIDLNKMINVEDIDVDNDLDYEMEKFSLGDNKKKRKNKKNMMDVEVNSQSKPNRNRRKNKKNKSYYIVNY
jgi:hypothetical protein